jgi:hypothetical protein
MPDIFWKLEPNFDGIVIGWSSSKIVSGSRALPPRWPPECSCVVIESSFDPGERLQAPGSLWFRYISCRFVTFRFVSFCLILLALAAMLNIRLERKTDFL